MYTDITRHTAIICRMIYTIERLKAPLCEKMVFFYVAPVIKWLKMDEIIARAPLVYVKLGR